MTVHHHNTFKINLSKVKSKRFSRLDFKRMAFLKSLTHQTNSGNSKTLALVSCKSQQLSPNCSADSALFSSSFAHFRKSQGYKTFTARTMLSYWKQRGYYVPEKAFMHLFHGINISLRSMTMRAWKQQPEPNRKAPLMLCNAYLSFFSQSDLLLLALATRAASSFCCLFLYGRMWDSP